MEVLPSLEEAIARAESRVIKAVFPSTTNHYFTLFGGTALQWMDEIAFITATRFSRQRYVTVSIDKTDFKKPIPAGTIVELVGTIFDIGKHSVKVEVTIFVEQMYKFTRDLAVRGIFTLVAVDENLNPEEIKIQR